jgi:hypothetical protein
MSSVRELSVEELKVLIGYTVEQKLEELLGDPDCDLHLQPDIEKRLRQSLEKTRSGEPGIPIDEVLKQTGLKW